MCHRKNRRRSRISKISQSTREHQEKKRATGYPLSFRVTAACFIGALIVRITVIGLAASDRDEHEAADEGPHPLQLAHSWYYCQLVKANE
jgi:hypothetical protein